MRIFIATISRDAVLIEIPDSAKVADLRKEISARVPEVKLVDQILKFESKVLLDGNSLKQSGITENSIIELLTFRKNTITVKMTSDHKTHELEVDFSKNVDALKKQITQLLKIPSDSQRLFLTELKNKDILSTSMIGPGTTVHLSVIDLNLKLNIVHTKSTFPAEIIEMPKGYKICQLKELILAKWKIPCAHQLLSYNGQVMDNKKTLADYNVQNMSTIYVKKINIEIGVDVSSLGRNRITVDALMTETIEAVKKKIQKLLKISPESQKLIWNGTVLTDRDTLADKGIVTGSTLSLIPIIQLFKINVSYDGLDIEIDTHLNETIAELKHKVQLATNISAIQQILSMAGTELQNDKKLFDFGIKGGTNLVMNRRDTFELRVETASGIDIMNLLIHNPYQDPIEIQISAMATVFYLKQIISAELNGVIWIDQVLKFGSKILNNPDTLKSCGISSNSILELTMQNCFIVCVRTEDNRNLHLDVNLSYTAELIKKMLNRLLNITIDRQRLFFIGKELQNGEDLKENLGVYANSMPTIDLVVTVLKLYLNIVQQSGHVEPIELQETATIGHLKQILLDKYKVPIVYQILTYNGQVLDKNENSLADCNLRNLSEIYFRRNDIEIFIQSTQADRKRTSLRVSPEDTIADVKNKIEVDLQINKCDQQLIWSGRLLTDGTILHQENIKDGSTLVLLVKATYKLNIQLEAEDIIQIDCQSNETVAQLKASIMAATQIPVDQQMLLVNNKILEDSEKLIDCDLMDGQVIIMQRKDSFEITVKPRLLPTFTITVHRKDKVSSVKAQIYRRFKFNPDAYRISYNFLSLGEDTLEAYDIDEPCIVNLEFNP